MDSRKTESFVNAMWDESIIPELCEYIRVPNKSPMFDPEWEKHGHMDRAVEMLEKWCREQPIKGMTTEVIRLEGRTPVLFMEIPGDSDDVVLLYGHYDKQPEFSGWDEDLDPWIPVIKDGKLYGRGGADDGYAVFGSLTAIRALQEQGIPHARCIVLIEGCEESGSFDLPHYIGHLGDRRAESRRVPRCRVRQLRPALVHDVAKRKPDGHAQRRCSHGGRALRLGRWRRAIVFPRSPPAAEPHRGRE